MPYEETIAVGGGWGMKSLDTVIEKLWGYPPSKLTTGGSSKIIEDAMALTVSGFLLVSYPHELSSDLTIRWAGAVVLLLLMLYAFFPQMVRLMTGKYEHCVEESDAV